MQSEELQPVSGVPVDSIWRTVFPESGKRPFIQNLHYQRAGKTSSKDKLCFNISRAIFCQFCGQKEHVRSLFSSSG